MSSTCQQAIPLFIFYRDKLSKDSNVETADANRFVAAIRDPELKVLLQYSCRKPALLDTLK